MNWFRSFWEALTATPAAGRTGSPEPTRNFTPHAQQALALARKEAERFHHNFVGTEHILLGLLHEGDGVASRVLRHLGVDAEKTRQEVLKQLHPSGPGTAANLKPPENPPNAQTPKSRSDAVDTSKRYDVYCWDKTEQAVVYRNALFKGRSKLLSTREHDFGAEFLELEQSNGHTVYLSLHSVFKFCEHGAEVAGEETSKHAPGGILPTTGV